MTWPEVQSVVERGGGVILPLGATEQHGFHLPLACDAICATDLALAVAEATDCVVAPPIVYGYRSRPMSGGGQGFIGTTGISGETLILTVRDLVREFLRHGFRRIVLLNWHNENSNFMYEGAYVALEGRRRVRTRRYWSSSPPSNGCLMPPWRICSGATSQAGRLNTPPSWKPP